MTFLIAGAFFFAQRKGIGKGMYVSRKNDKEMKNRIRKRWAACGKRKTLLKMGRGNLLILSNNIVFQD